MQQYRLSHLDALEAESIHVIREVAATCERPVLLYSAGKDSSVLLRLAARAFHPGRVPFPLLHVDTGMKFPQMYAFRDGVCRDLGLELIVHRNEPAIGRNANPWDLGTSACCGLLKTQALLEALAKGRHDAAIGGARRDEERSRAKERIFSVRDTHGQWDPRAQRPEPWSIYNTNLRPGASLRVFPLSNWTELDVWQYIERENIPVVPMYFAEEREMIIRGDQLIPVEAGSRVGAEDRIETVLCRYRTLGCFPCTGAVRSGARTISEIIVEVRQAQVSERIARAIDHDQDGSMEIKKREGYF